MDTEAMPKCPKCGAALLPDALAGLCPRCVMAMNLATETALPGEPLAAQSPLPPEQIAPHFPQLEILKCLGRGGMGVVYKARQKTLNRLVALKLLAPERVGDAKFAERFAREAQALAALNHPNIITIYDFGQAGGFYFLLMEFVDGVNLRQLLRARKFTPEEALAIVPPLCDALQFAHERGIVHRDIKPENLLLDKTGRVKVADFGIAKILGGESNTPAGAGHAPAGGHTLTEVDKTMGTPGYSAPEQKSDPQRVDSRADIYSLGVVFYEMLTGELPGKKIEPPSRKVQIDVRLDEIVMRALEQQPELRYQQASVFKTQVETIISGPANAEKPGAHQKSDFEARFGGAQPPPHRWRDVFGAAPTLWCRYLETSYYRTTLTSGLAIRLANLSELGFLGFFGFLGALGFVGPAMKWCYGLYGFTGLLGFFGLIGAAHIREMRYRRRPSVTAVSGGNRQHGAARAEKSGIEPRFSRTAIVGASCAAGAMIALVWFNILSGERVTPWGHMNHPERLGFILTELVGMLGWLSPLVTTIVGWIAVSQIRRSAGKLCGLGLALFDGLLFPLLALDFFVIVAVENFVRQSFGPAITTLIFTVAVVGFGWLDFLIIRAVWRRVNKLADGSPVPYAKRFYGSIFAFFAFCFAVASGVLGIATFCRFPHPPGLLVCSIPLAALPGILMGIKRRQTRLGITAILAGSLNLVIWLAIAIAMQFSQPLPFDPVVEREITVGNDAHSFYSFDRGDYVPGPTDFDPADEKNNVKLWKWMTQNHVDVFAQTRDGRPVLVRSEMVATDLNEDDFDRLSPAGLDENSTWTGLLKVQMRPQESSTLSRGNLRGNKDTLVFQNRYEVTGLLQVVEITSNPPGVKIRYKLVPSPQPKPAAVPDISFGPVHEITLHESGDSAFLNLDTEQKWPAFTGEAADFNNWKKAHGVDLAAAKLATGEKGVGGFDLAVTQISNDHWLTVTPIEIVHAGDTNNAAEFASNVFLNAGCTYAFATRKFGIGVIQVAGSADQTNGITVRYKMVQVPVKFGPTFERVIDLTDPGHQALNLSSGSYVWAAPGGAAALRAAGVDLYSLGSSEIIALDMRFWDDSSTEEKVNPPNSPDPWANVDDSPAFIWWTEENPLLGYNTSDPQYQVFTGLYAVDKARRLKGCEDVIRGTNVCFFTTRDGTGGVLQIAGYLGDPDKPTAVKIRYKLVQTAQPQPAIEQSSSFGPVTENEITNDFMLDFDTGKIATDFPESVTRPDSVVENVLAAFDWMQHEGVDFAYLERDGTFSIGMKLKELTSDDWSRLVAAELPAYFATPGSGAMQAGLNLNSNSPSVYGFQTREGSVGILQITGITGNPRGVKLRYKLMQTTQSTKAAPATAAESGMRTGKPLPSVDAGHTDEEATERFTQEGWQLWQEQRFLEAENRFKEAIALAPRDANAWNGLGWAEFKSGKNDEAEKAFQKVVPSEPNYPAAMNGLGQLYWSERRFDKAETYLLKAAPGAPAAWHSLAQLYLLEAKFDQAEKWAQDIVDSGQVDEVAKKMLEAAKAKRLSEGLRMIIEPPLANSSGTNPPAEVSAPRAPAVATNEWRTAMTMDAPEFKVIGNPLFKDVTPQVTLKSVKWDWQEFEWVDDRAGQFVTQAEVRLPEAVRSNWDWQMQVYDSTGQQCNFERFSPNAGTNGEVDPNVLAQVVDVPKSHTQKIVLQCRALTAKAGSTNSPRPLSFKVNLARGWQQATNTDLEGYALFFRGEAGTWYGTQTSNELRALPRLSLASIRGSEALAQSLGKDDIDKLKDLAEDIGRRNEEGKLADSFGGPCAFGNFGTARYRSAECPYIQFWYVTDGTDVIFASYHSGPEEPNGGEIRAVQEMINTVTLTK